MFDLDNLMELVDQEQIEFIEEDRQPLNKARLQQGNADFAGIAEVNQTVLYLGGIGLSVEGLREDIISKGTIVTNSYNGHSADYAVFRELEVVVLAPSRNRRHYMEVEGQMKLACGSNSVGAHSRGWSGMLCKACPWHKDNIESHGYSKDDACKNKTNQLIYIPSLDHVAILELSGTSYMESVAWLDQLSKLSRTYAQKPEIQAKAPGLKRLNPFFFKTTLTTGPFQQGPKGMFQPLVFTKAVQPFDWDNLLASPEMVKKAKEHWDELKDFWKPMFVDHNPNAVMSLPSAEAVAAAALPANAAAALPANSSVAQPAPALVSTVVVPEVVAPQVQPVAQPAPAQPAVAQQPAQQVPGVTVSQIAIPEEDESQELPPVNVPMGF